MGELNTAQSNDEYKQKYIVYKSEITRLLKLINKVESNLYDIKKELAELVENY